MDQTTKQIIRSLAMRQTRETILRDLCERYRLEWNQADHLVTEIERKYASDISSKHRPSLILQASLLALGGFLLAVYPLFLIFTELNINLINLPISDLGYAGFFIVGLVLCWAGTRNLIRMLREQG